MPNPRASLAPDRRRLLELSAAAAVLGVTSTTLDSQAKAQTMTDQWDKVDVIPFDAITQFFDSNL